MTRINIIWDIVKEPWELERTEQLPKEFMQKETEKEIETFSAMSVLLSLVAV